MNSKQIPNMDVEQKLELRKSKMQMKKQESNPEQSSKERGSVQECRSQQSDMIDLSERNCFDAMKFTFGPNRKTITTISISEEIQDQFSEPSQFFSLNQSSELRPEDVSINMEPSLRATSQGGSEQSGLTQLINQCLVNYPYNYQNYQENPQNEAQIGTGGKRVTYSHQLQWQVASIVKRMSSSQQTPDSTK